jgi:hypothetical protein
MTRRQDSRPWAEEEFRGVPRLEKRFRDRLVDLAARLAERPDGSLPQRLPDWADLKGAYRLIGSPKATPDVLQAAHRDRTRERMDRDGVVLIVHDSTQLDFSTHAAVADALGPVGDNGGRGFIQHNSLAVDPERGELLGLIHQQTFIREPAPAKETRADRQRRPDRESAVWGGGIKAVGRAPAGRTWVHVGDRGADYFEPMAVAGRYQAHFLIRLCQDRRVHLMDAAGEPDGYLLRAARELPAEIADVVAVPSKGGRPARTAEVVLASCRLLIRPPAKDKAWAGHPPIAATVIRVWEPDPPADVEEPLEWVLGTDLRVRGPADLLLYRDYYGWRWPTAEEYHKVQKTGCGIEDVRFEHVSRLLAAIALISVVAIRVLALRWQRDVAPEAPAESVATGLEIRVVQRAGGARGSIRTVRQFVDAVAKLGGYLGRTGDGPPGWQSLWRGYQRLADLMLGAEIAQELRPDDDKLPSVKPSG